MEKIFVSCRLLALWLVLDCSGVWAVDVGWMQKGVRVWYFGAVGSITASDAEEAYMFSDVNGYDVQVTKHSGSNHWVSTQPVSTSSYSFLDKGPCWIHPQVLQTLKSGDTWKGQTIATVLRNAYTYDTLKAEFTIGEYSIPYLLLPIKALFDLNSQRNLVKIVYYLPDYSTGIAYFDADTGLLLLYETSNGYVTVFFFLSEINYDFATKTAFAEDNGPHTGFLSFVLEQQMMPYPDTRIGAVLMQSPVESRYGNTVQMWTAASVNGSSLPDKNYCFFGSVPVLRHIDKEAVFYPPEQWNPYGQYLWWWVPTGALQNSTINVFNVPMTRTSTSPYTFTATQEPTGFFFSKLWFDNDGYMTAFAAKDSTTGLDIDPGYAASYYNNSTRVDGLAYYKNTMGNATPPGYTLALTVVSDTADKGGGSINGDGGISCDGHGSSPSGMSGKCQADFSAGTSVNLTQSPDSDSTWAAWSVAGCGTNLSCQVLMNGAKNVTVTFPYSPMAKVNSTNQGFESLPPAYGNAASVDTIYGRAVTFPENFTLASSKAITLLGGRDAWYQTQNAWTTLQGVLTIQSGALTVEKLIID